MTTNDHSSIDLLAGKVAVIVGAGRGIGKVTAKVFACEGAKVVVADISGDETTTAAEIGPTAVPFRVDVTREDQVAAMFAAAIKAFGHVDASVHLAGPPGGRRDEDITVAEYEQVVGTHLGGMLLCTEHAVRAMLPRRGGAIVNFSSTASFNADRRISLAYAAAKAGINSMTKSYAVLYGSKGIRVNAVAPGFTFSEKNLAMPPDVMADLSAGRPIPRSNPRSPPFYARTGLRL